MKQTDLVKAIHTASPKTLHAAYEAVCEAYAQRLCAQLGFMNREDAYWIGDEPGGVLAVGIDAYFLNMETVVLVVDNAMSYEDFDEWYIQWTDYDMETWEPKPNRINLESWLKGARPDIINLKNNDMEEKTREYTPKRKWRITCTEEKLRLMADCVEDCSRLLAGQTDMSNTLMPLENFCEIRDIMEERVRPLIVPDLPYRGSSYGWNGGHCPVEWQRKTIAQGYATYKSLLAGLAREYNWNNVHSGTPLTCELGGELMDVRPVDESEPETVDYWTAADPDGRQYTFRSKPVRCEWANGWGWEPSAGGSYIGEEGTKVLMELLGLPKLTWDDEPYGFTILKPKSK